MITYKSKDIFSDLTKPFTMLHVVNNAHKWGAGFTAPLTENFPQCKKDYFDRQVLRLGEVIVTPVGSSSEVIGLISQHNVFHPQENPRPLDYEFLYVALETAKKVLKHKDNVILPKLGAGLSRGNWNIIEVILNEVLSDCGEITVYEINNR